MPCPGTCPIRDAGLDLPCPCVRHPRFAELMAADPVVWAPKLVENARIHAGLAEGSQLENPRTPRVEFVTPYRRRSGPRRVGDPVRVGLLTPCLYLGGAEVWLAELIAHTDPKRFEWSGVAVLDPLAIDPGMVARLRGLGAVVRHDARAVAELPAACDVVLAWGFDPYLECSSAVADKPLVLISHGIGAWTAKGLASASRATALVAVSQAAVAPYPEAERSRVRVIHNGIDPARVVPSADGRARVRAEWGAENRHLVLYLGRVSNEKNPRAFVEAGRICETRWPNQARFVVAGGGLGFEAERAWAAEHAPGVHFAGPRDDVADCLAAADTLVLPSHEEACSLSMLEALTAGVPVLATPVGHLSDPTYAPLARLLPMHPTGAEIAETLALDLLDRAGRAARVAAAIEAMRSFTADRMAAEYAALIEAVAPPPSQLENPRRSASPPVVSLADQTAALHALTPEQRTSIDVCRHKTRKAACCDSVADFCTLGRGRNGFIRLFDCVQCVGSGSQLENPGLPLGSGA